jgi:hypothetical protein
VPADLGYYDMRLPETRAAQAALAREYGVEAFCYWHYWFDGQRLLERPVDEILASGEPDFPFCLAWANHSWTGVWLGEPKRMLKEQTYPGPADHERHFHSLLPAFRDRRYLTVEGKPLFVVFRPNDIPELPRFAEQWRDLARREGLPGLHLVGIWGDGMDVPSEHGFDGATLFRLTAIHDAQMWSPRRRLENFLLGSPAMRWLLRGSKRPRRIYTYSEAMKYFIFHGNLDIDYYPTVIPNFDNTPRSGINGFVLHDSKPTLFAEQVKIGVAKLATLPTERKLLFVKSWNEWAEGNHLEPDLRFGRAYLEALSRAIRHNGSDRPELAVTTSST